MGAAASTACSRPATSTASRPSTSRSCACAARTPTRRRSTSPTRAGCCRAASTSSAPSRPSRRGDGEPVFQPRSDVEIVAALSRILGDEQRQTRGLGRHVSTATPSRVGEHRREAERAVADVGGSDPRGLDDVALAEAIANLADIESRISRSRRQVQAVVDLLTEEIARRYQAGEVTAGAR